MSQNNIFCEDNKKHRVVLLVSISFLCYFLLSVGVKIFNIKWEAFEKINLVSDIWEKPKEMEKLAKKTSVYTLSKTLEQDFNFYQKPEFITNFQRGDSVVALPKLAEKLHLLKQTHKGKIRIAYFGDSMIEGDLITQTIRQLLQQEFGGAGVGYLPIFSNVAGFRQTAKIKSSGFNDTHFMDKSAKNLYLSGHYFTGNGEGSYEDFTIKNQNINIEKALIIGQSDTFNLNVNGQYITLEAKNKVNRKVVANDKDTRLNIKTNSGKTPIYGVSFESENGVILDNFSFRGITGVELNKIDEDFFKAVQNANAYDLIVFQYGVNLLFRPKDKDYSYYEKMITPVFKKMKNAFPNTEFLLVGAGDRAFRYDGQYKTAVGLPYLLELQARLAMENNFAFYNQFASMGGENSILKWAEAQPALANKDYIHPNAKGAEVLAQKLFSAIMKDYKNYKPKKK